MSITYCQCQSTSLSLKVIKCNNSKLQMLTSTVHTAVLTTPNSSEPLVLCHPSCLYFLGCVNKISLTMYDPMWSHPAEACDVSHVRVYRVLLLYFLLIKICWISTEFGKLFILYTVYYFLLISISVYYNYNSTFIWFCFI